MLTHLRLFRIVSTIGIITVLFSSLPFTPVSAQENFDATPSLPSTTWYVANTGSDLNSCLTADHPCKTISGAIGKATAGDTVKVARGTYMETVSIGNGKGMTILGGWNSTFSVQIGFSIIDGQDMRNGLTVFLSTIVLDRFIIRNCHSPSGAGVSNNGGTLTISNSSIQHNTSDSDGAGISNMQGILILINTSIHNNSAASISSGAAGGGIYNWGSIVLNNVTISNNYASLYGGGIYSAQDARVVLNNVTITNNSTSLYGGGIFHSTAESMQMRNSILAGNTSADRGPDCYGYVRSFGYNLIGNNTDCAFFATMGDNVGTQEIPINPLLTPLQNTGGLTLNHALLPGSPAIDAGNPGLSGTRASACLTLDQRGVSRPQGAACDMGAVETKNFLMKVWIGNSAMASYQMATSGSQRQNFAGVNEGPVKIQNTNPIPIMMAERVIYKVKGVNTSFSEMMAVPNNQLDTTYWLPWYNNVDLDSQLRFANVSGSQATVHIWIGGQEVTGSPFTLAPGASGRQSFAGLNNGPVRIESNVPIVASQRIIYKVNGVNTSYSEMMALPNRQLDTTYWLPWYNNFDLTTELGVSNVSAAPATVHVAVGGWKVLGSPFTLAPGASLRTSVPNLNTGPVSIRSDVPIIAVQRVTYKVNGVDTSYSEMMAFPNNQADMVYWLPWYNNVDLDSELRVTNVSDQHAKIHVYAAGREVTGSPFFLLDVASLYISFPGINAGPIKIDSNVPIVVSERVIYKVKGENTSFSEMTAIPAKQMDTTYWLPWYNNVDLDTQLRFGVP